MTNIAALVARPSLQGVGGIAVCLIALAIVYFGFDIGGESPKKDANASTSSSAPLPSQKPVQAMNLALGNMVFLAKELGFSIKTAKVTPYENNKVALRIESHLKRLRELYRQESGKNPNLVGSVLLRFNISAAGEVSQVKEVSSRINDGELRKAIVAEVLKWSFADVVSETLTITCPLLFVREGMDITTLVLWEKSLANLNEQPSKDRTAVNLAPIVDPKKQPSVAVKSEPNESEIKYSTLLRKEPKFSSTALTTLTAGSKVTVINKTGDWLEVRATADGPTGFIRKEFAKPVEVARR